MVRRPQIPNEPAPAPPLSAAELAARFADLAPSSAPILAAVSGGPDSTALMHALAAWAAQPGRPAILVATVDHGLRPEARAEAEAVAAAASRLGLQHRVLTWSPPPARISQEQARRARYALLGQFAIETGAGTLVTAHTLDDQAETILMRAAAGSGLSGLAGMRRVVARGPVRHLRPLLDVSKARLVATCRANGWAFIEDPSNADPAYARGRWRRLLPLLAAEGLDSPRIATLAARLARADHALDVLAQAALTRTAATEAGGATVLDFAALAGEPDEIGLRALALALHATAGRLPGLDTAGEIGGTALPPLRLERLEACFAALVTAQGKGKRLRRTLAGRQLTLNREGRLSIEPEPPRRRGTAQAAAAVTEIAAAAPHSLGRGDMRA